MTQGGTITDGLAIVLGLVLLGLPIAVVVVVVRSQRRRREAVHAWAAAHGWRVIGTDPALVDHWRGPPFGVGSSRRATEVMVTTGKGRTALSFTYSYVTGGGEHSTTHAFHVVAVPLPAPLPMLQLIPDTFGPDAFTGLGLPDLQLESHEFNDAWKVEAPDPRFAHDVLHPRLMERLLRPDARDVRLRFCGTDLLTWCPGRTDVDRIRERVALMTDVIDAIPRFVWENVGAPGVARAVPPMPPLPPTPPPARPAEPAQPALPSASPFVPEREQRAPFGRTPGQGSPFGPPTSSSPFGTGWTGGDA